MSVKDTTDRIAMVLATTDIVEVLDSYGIKMCAGNSSSKYLGDVLMIYDRRNKGNVCNCMTFLDDYADEFEHYTSWFGDRLINILELHTVCRAIKEDRLDELLAECDRYSGETD